MNDADLLSQLLASLTLKDARRAVHGLTQLGYVWTPLGNKEGNFGLVNIGSDPGFAFVERVTNALDALIDHAARAAPAAVVAGLSTPRAAVATLFAIPEGRVVHAAPERQDQIAAGAGVLIGDGSLVARPRLEVRDSGTGLAPDDMPATILNLAGSNKISKPYLAGAYGQGGSTTFAFSPDGTVIASATDQSDVGVTFVRYAALDARTNKNGRYEYLTRPRERGVGRIERARTAFPRGTLVRHFDYDLGGYVGDARRPERSLLALMQTALFDPILPFTIIEARSRYLGDPALPATLVYSGRFARLASSAERGAVEYAQSTAIPLEPRGADNVATAHYWVLSGSDALLHPDPRHPIVMTNFGQTHGVEDRRVIVDALRLPFLKNDLVVQIELDGLSSTVKRDLLSTTRDRLKRGSRYTELIDAIVEALADDPQLAAANTRRRLQLLEKQHKTDYQKLRRRFAELIEKFRPGDEAAAKRSPAGTNGSIAGGTANAAGAGGEPETPLPTLDHPTFLRITRSAEPLELRRRRRSVVTVESDAPDAYLAVHESARLVMVDPTLTSFTFVRSSDFRGGRARLTLRTELPAASTGTLIARLTDAHGNVHMDAAPYRVVEPPPPEPASEDGTGRVRVPEIYEVHAAEWPKFAFDETSVARAEESRDDYSIFVNMDNRHLHRLLTTTDYQSAGIARMKSSFLVQVAFYTFLLHEGRASTTTIDDVALETYQLRELDRVAQTVITSIAAIERIDSAALFDGE
jgi:hypothetical protein